MVSCDCDEQESSLTWTLKTPTDVGMQRFVSPASVTLCRTLDRTPFVIWLIWPSVFDRCASLGTCAGDPPSPVPVDRDPNDTTAHLHHQAFVAVKRVA